MAENKLDLVSNHPNRNFRQCYSCDRRFHLNDLNTVDVEEYGRHNTLEVCDNCIIKPNVTKIEEGNGI